MIELQSSLCGSLPVGPITDDGDADSPDSYYKQAGYPFSLTVDLGQQQAITQVDLTTRMTQGSETYYKFNVLGSNDNKKFDQIADQSSNTAVGFVPTLIDGSPSYRYVQINASDVINTYNGNSATAMGGVIEYTVYGH